MASRSVGEVVGAQVKKAREKRPWTQQQLVDRLAELGHPMNRVTLSKLERPGSTRAKNVSLVDVLALAAALDIPPTLLFLPLGKDDRVAITPTIEIHPDLAQKWVEGEGPLADSDRYAINPAEWRQAARTLHMFQDLRRRRRKAHEAKAELLHKERLGERPEDPVYLARAKYIAALTTVAHTIHEMQEDGLRTAGLLTEQDYEDMAAFGIDIKRED